MFGIPSIGKILVFAIIVAAVWYGFKYLGRVQRVEKGERKGGERTFGERLRKATRGRSGDHDTGVIEDTEKCATCGAYVSVEGSQGCGKPNCPY